MPARGASGQRFDRVTWVGLAAFGVVVVLVLGPLFLRARKGPTPAPSVSSSEQSREARIRAVREAGLAAAAVAELAVAADALSQVKTQVEGQRLPPAPPVSSYASPTACVRSYLPGIELPEGSLDFVCTEADVWTLERRFYEQLSHRPGEGVRRYTRLGHYSVAVIATVRRGCCEAPEPLSAVVAGLWCGILRDELAAFGPVPEPEKIRAFDAMMSCLLERGMRLPERWDRIPMERSVSAFAEFSDRARQRCLE